ncbi:leucine-rich repeat domain-containing protein [Bifidobacterium sp. ESL0784]|uniref:leucine-rich repeat domain-containing protein n=1 Tax=Bifidobacterium sp. ESL0784 TaxID=2983231 RepID=UPI0023F8594F|nr:leucine-rich repeat domain-containing protein [Bifidobacterium sp. ESL0784]MDF7640658.1 leucine-rich repeat domain-containing protein [Bifidobacterium sp. ESL0784]
MAKEDTATTTKQPVTTFLRALSVAFAAFMVIAMIFAPCSVSAAQVRHDCKVGSDSIADCFPDEALAKDVARAEHVKTTNIFTQKMVDTTTKLNAFKSLNGRVESLKGIENLVNLTYLNIDGNYVQSLARLANLTKLQTLYCNGNEVSDFSPLSKLTSLQVLSLNNRQDNSGSNPDSLLSIDLAPLAGLIGLKVLRLNNLKFKSVASLAGLVNLNELDIESAGIIDGSPLASLVNLTRLDISKNDLGSIDMVRSMTNLRKLYAGQQNTGGSLQIRDVSALETLTNLQELDLSGNAIADISPLRGMANMRVLWIGGNRISDISTLSGMTALTSLSIDYNEIQSLEPLRGLTQLRTLKADDNNISDISPLAGLTKLEGDLDLSDNQISDISLLANCDKIWDLELENNKITDISVLAKMASISSADFGGNAVRDATLPAKVRDEVRIDLDRQYTLLDDAATDQLTLKTGKDFDGKYIKPKMYPKNGHYDPTTGVATWKSAGDADHISLTFWDAKEMHDADFIGMVSRHIQGVPPKQTHSVSFTNECGLHVPDQQVRDEDVVNLPDVPITCDGKGFSRWRVKDGKDESVIFGPDAINEPVTEDMELNAKWEDTPSSIFYDEERTRSGKYCDGPADEDEYVHAHPDGGDEGGSLDFSWRELALFFWPITLLGVIVIAFVVLACCLRIKEKSADKEPSGVRGPGIAEWSDDARGTDGAEGLGTVGEPGVAEEPSADE